MLDLKSQMAGEEITVNDLADRIGVSRATVHAWMSPNGVKTPPTAEKQSRLDRFFGVNWKQMWELMEVENDIENAEDTQEMAAVGT
jgi:plasmid maintenance system antidote protein VapI